MARLSRTALITSGILIPHGGDGCTGSVGGVVNEAVVGATSSPMKREMRISWGLTLRERSLTVQTDAQILQPKQTEKILPAITGMFKNYIMIYLIHRSVFSVLFLSIFPRPTS